MNDSARVQGWNAFLATTAVLRGLAAAVSGAAGGMLLLLGGGVLLTGSCLGEGGSWAVENDKLGHGTILGQLAEALGASVSGLGMVVVGLGVVALVVAGVVVVSLFFGWRSVPAAKEPTPPHPSLSGSR